ncbi:MAG: hypothetical protein HC915_16450 [Anaerolineae bacterium]|nr:hypothetical protein [Anaerolineae bacterium]
MLRLSWLLLLLIGALTLSACNFEVDRNDDGSLSIIGTADEAAIIDAVQQSIQRPDLNDVQVDLRQGNLFVTAQRLATDGSPEAQLTFILTLGVVNGRLAATISDVQTMNLGAIDAARVAEWNARLSDRLERAGQRSVDTTLQAVRVTEEGIVMEWRRETRRSRGNN